MAGLDTIDIEDLAKNFKADTLRMETKLIVSGIVAGSPWLAAAGPFAKVATELLEGIIEELLDYLNTQIGWIAFRFNTTVFTTDQGKDYIATIEKRNKLPDDVPDEIWIKAEEEANHALFNLANYKR